MTDKQIEKWLYDSDKNLFITGAGGTGKTYLINEAIKRWTDEKKNIVICASTGIAALKLGGETLHKAFHIPVKCFDSPSFAKNTKGAIKNSQLKAISTIDIIIIDEISMVRCDTFDYFYKIIRKVERDYKKHIRLIVIGDFLQLPPVVSTSDEKELVKHHFKKEGYCFTSLEWQKAAFKVIELTEVKRTDNLQFISKLNDLRSGHKNKRILDYFNKNCVVNDLSKIDDGDYIYLCGKNATAQKINKEYLDLIDKEIVYLKARVTGRNLINQWGSWIDPLIEVKEGCRVIFTANDPKNRYKNGTFGVFKKYLYKTEKYPNGVCIVEINGKDIFIEAYRYDINTYGFSAKDGYYKKTIGDIYQYPFKLGKAITIHKSQGQTFDKCIIVPEIFTDSQLYVALSRLSNIEGLILTEEITKDMCFIHPIVRKFISSGYKYTITRKKETNNAKKQSKRIKKSNTKTTNIKKSVTKSKKQSSKVKKGTKRKTNTKSTKRRIRTKAKWCR